MVVALLSKIKNLSLLKNMGEVWSEFSSAQELEEKKDKPKSNVDIEQYYQTQALAKKYYTPEKQKESFQLKITTTEEQQILYRVHTNIKIKYIKSEEILNDLKQHKCKYGSIYSDEESDTKYRIFNQDPEFYINSNEKQQIIKLLNHYFASIVSQEIISYLNQSEKTTFYCTSCHSANIGRLRARYNEQRWDYTFQPICNHFLKSKIAIFRNYYRPLAPIINIAIMGSNKIGKSSFCLRWEQNKFIPSYTLSKNRDFYQKEIILNEQEISTVITNDFGFGFSLNDKDDNKCDKDLYSARLNVDVSKMFVRIYDIKDENEEEFDDTIIDIIFICFAIDDKKSFRYLQNWLMKNKKENDNDKQLVVIIALKSEMKNDSFYRFNKQYLVSASQIQHIAAEVPYFEVSAKTGRNVQFAVIQSIYECWFQCCKL